MSTAPADRAGSLSLRIAEEIRVLLVRRRWNPTRLSRELGVSQTYVWRRLSGETAFDVDDLERIAEVLQVDVLALLPDYARKTTRDCVPERVSDRPVDNRPPGRGKGRAVGSDWSGRRPTILGDLPMVLPSAAA